MQATSETADVRRVRLLILVFLGLMAAWGAEPGGTLLRYAPPDAKAVIGISWRAARQGPLNEYVQRRPGSVPGQEFLDQVDELVLCSTGIGVDDKEPPVLVILTGKFDLRRMRQELTAHGARPQQFEGITVWRSKRAGDISFVLVDQETVLAGDAHSIYAALNRAAAPARKEAPSPLLQRAAVLHGGNDLWAVMTSSPAGLIRQLAPVEVLAGATTGLELTASFRSGLHAEIRLRAADEELAKQLHSDLKAILRSARNDHKTPGPVTLFTDHLEARRENDSVVLRLNLGMDALRSALQFRVVEKTPVAKVEAPPEKQMIRIQGLDEGTREIEYKNEYKNK